MDNGANGGTAKPGAGSFALGLLTGAAIIGIVALVYAPRPGEQTREMWRTEISKTQQMFQGWMNDLNERIEKFSQLIRLSTVKEVPISKDYERTPS